MNPLRNFSIRSVLLGMGLLALILYGPWQSLLCECCAKKQPLAPDPILPTKNPPEQKMTTIGTVIPPEPVMPRGSPNDSSRRKE